MRFLFALLLVCARLGQAGAATDDARAVIAQVQERLRADASWARYEMHIVTPEWQRSLRFDAWDDRKGRRFLIRMRAPRKERGVSWLKDGANLWMYLPRLERDIRIPPSMMLSSWMGSDFTNDDLVKMESLVDDYRHRILAEDGQTITIESLPRPEAAVVWGRIVHVVGRDGLPRQDDYYDEHGRHVRRLIFSAPAVMDGRRIPTRWVMITDAKPGHRTELILKDVRFNPPLPDELFTRANLRRGLD
ncbi:MAG: outer membrane lipoprotein-sorting protein [Zetaproteobacteria bacterium]|nr:MAG: outer membrane lipoprotein-sorting protein [Zetaproteobacteria bacterium]